MAAVTRTTSLIASAGLLGAAVIAALTMSITMLPPPAGIDGNIIDMVTERPPEPPPIIRESTPPPPSSTDLVEPQPFEPVQTIETSASNTPHFVETGPAVETITRPHWLRRPSNLQIYYPRRAIQNEINGDVVLDCLVTIAGALNCSVVSETPPQWGFGAAALRIAADHRMEPAVRNGVAVEGRYRMRVPFRVE